MSEHVYIPVGDMMATEVHTIAATATVAQAVAMMRQYGVSSLMVERRDDHDEFAIIVVSDIARRVIAENRAPERVNIYEIMTKPVFSLPSEMDIRYAVRMLSQFELSRAVVIDHDRMPIGIVTLRDMVLHDRSVAPQDQPRLSSS
jgi:signal-transduction protein with cAMP-binding, CBS, and nucleotidyltransferase domain